MTNSNVLSAPKADATIQTSWMSSKNDYLSAILEQTVTNKQMLLLGHCFTAFFSLFVGFASNLLFAGLAVAWFGVSVMLAKKGGLK